jgi:hypothetical protein
MRTLFLVGILAILILIAVKEPDKTAMETINGFAEDVKTVVSNAGEDMGVPTATTSLQQIEDALSSIKLGEPLEQPEEEHQTSTVWENGALDLGASIVNQGSTDQGAEVAASGESSWEIPAQDFSDMSELPPIPGMPVEVQKLSENSPSNQAPSFTDDYEQVRQFYENASILLGEIE